MATPKVAAIHDLSGFGRCSLTVALPVLSAMGVQCCPLPTAFLSTHTGGFEGFTFLDMTEEMPKAARHWASLGLRFDAIYSGFLAGRRQIGIVADFIRTFRTPETRVIVDPVMGDDGSIYQTYTPELCAGMAELAELADVVTPNLTEAALLLGWDYGSLFRPGGRQDPDRLRRAAELLSRNGKRSVALTGVSEAPGRTGALCYDARSGSLETIQTDFGAHPLLGTGDIFASVLTGALVKGASLGEAARQASEFIRACAERTVAEDLPLREGVDFEPLLGLLTDKEGTL
ncbi:pyridoxamine kinase [Dysosmobacter sp.]|uniref:pyridoxamine kinase n=1 Tax=Dysosmobacter sp. TaxID=2591382 RepID=UPI002A8531D1|nr:pyridoxamine kinase [Dysosmobacter sp.]MDY3281956.1 pyridoxamine kinase [Dysosmobacter sp.]